MKVIKHGCNYRKPISNNDTMTSNCPCGCELTYNKYDIKSDYVRLNAYESDNINYIECPECGYKMILNRY
jgi:hypothetical protein